MQSLFEAGAEIQFRVLEVVNGDHLCRISVHLTFQRAAVGGVDPVLDDHVFILEVDKEVPAVDVEYLFHADIVVGKIAFVNHFFLEGVKDGETGSKGVKLPFHIIGPTLCFWTIIPIHASLHVPETVEANAVVVRLIITVLHVGFLYITAHVVDGDEEIVGGRIELIDARKGLRGRFHWFLNHNRDFVRIKNGEFGYGFSIVVIASGNDTALAYAFCDNLNAVAILDSLEADDFRSVNVEAVVVAVLERLPDNGVAYSHLKTGLVCLLSHNKAAEA